MNILFIVHRIPYPPNKGDKIRSYNEIKYLAQRHNLYLAFLVDDEKDLANLDELRKYCVDLDYDVINPQWQKLKSMPYLLTKKPLSVPYFYSKKLQKAIDKRIVEAKIDAVICFSSPMAEYVFRSKTSVVSNSRSDRLSRTNSPWLIMDFVDVDSDKWRMYSDFSKFPHSFIYKREWKTLMSYERKIGNIFDQSIFVSDKEAELFKSFCPASMAVSIPNGVDYEFYNDVRSVRNDRDVRTSETIEHPCMLHDQTFRSNILFIGAMDYFPNEDAVLYFSSEIWPLVKKRLPQTKFFVIGGKPSGNVKRLSGSDGNIIVTGFVPDVKPYLSMADVLVAPLRIARGLQNKVLEAMAAGVPVVARPEAIQGFNGHDGCVEVADSSESFAMSVLKVIEISHMRNRMVNDSRRFILENHSWDDNLKKWDKVLTQ